MAGLRFGVIAAVVRKDLLSLWPLALGALLLPIYLAAPDAIVSPLSTESTIAIGILAVMALVLAVLQQDSPANVRLDSRSRPISPANLLAAKLVFIGLTVALPIVVAELIQERMDGHVWSEAILSSLSVLTSGLFFVALLVAFGFMTTSLIQAGATAFGFVILAYVVTRFMPAAADLIGPQWVVNFSSQAIGLIFSIVAVVLLFRRNDLLAARACWIAGLVLAVFAARYFPPEVAVAVQQSVSPKSQVAERLKVKVSEPCLGDGLLKAWREGGTTRPGAQVSLVADGLPDGWLINVDHASVRYLDARGKTLRRRAVYTNSSGGKVGWSLVAEAGPVASAKSMEWAYAVTLLEPVVSHDLPTDGRRRFLPGVGYCDASDKDRERGVVVSCFDPIDQPAITTARIKGDAERPCLRCGTLDYTPAVLSGFGKSHKFVLRSKPARPAAETTAVTLTAYRARGGVSHRSITSAPSATTAQTCPAETPGAD